MSKPAGLSNKNNSFLNEYPSLLRRRSTGLARLLVVIVLAAPLLRAQGYTDLHDFGASVCCPQYPLVMAQGQDGNLYGVIPSGGLHSKGLIFKVGPTGSYTVLHSFDGPHGSTPIGGLTLGLDGDLYGTTEEGAANGFGNIFKITPAGAFTVLHDFKGSTDGGYPVSPLTLGRDGNFYGTSYPGFFFRMTAVGVVTPLGTIPGTTYGALLQAKDGTFYGVTQFDGTYSAGTVYQITGNTYKILHSFMDANGSYPVGGLVEGADGNFYGTTTAGGMNTAGVIYRITPAGAYKSLYNFESAQPSPGYQSYAGLIAGADGNLYGVTIWGGLFSSGVIFSMTTGGGYTELYDFDAPTGVGAYSTPMQHTNGEIFGMTARGGAGGKGVLYSFGDGLAPFAHLLPHAGLVGDTIGILGRGFAQATGVEFNGTAASFHVVSNTYITATVPSGETGFVTVETASGHLTSSSIFRVTPTLTGFTPKSGKVGDVIVITGTGLIQATNLTVGNQSVNVYTVNSDSKLTTKVPAGAKSGKIVVTTPGGKVTSQGTFTVTP
jgi:uncharacterized repeat protein (TIGR03803 family)